MSYKLTMILLTFVFFLCSGLFLYAQAPMMINYQGKLNIPGMATEDSIDMTFIIYEDSFSITQPVWSKEYNNVQLSNGIFTVLLGPFTPEVFNGNGERWLEVNAGSQRLLPRYRLVSVPYAMYSNSASTLSAADGDPQNAVVVDVEGNVGIGTTDPEAKLHINGIVRSQPIVARWYATNHKTYGPANYEWGNEIFNTAPEYMSLVLPDNDEIEIKIPGYYLISVNVLQVVDTTDTLHPFRGNVFLKRNEGSIAQSLGYTGRNDLTDGHTFIKHDITIIEYFTAGDKISVYMKKPGSIYASPQGVGDSWSSLQIHRIN